MSLAIASFMAPFCPFTLLPSLLHVGELLDGEWRGALLCVIMAAVSARGEITVVPCLASKGAFFGEEVWGRVLC
jgi:hypothetical protein